MSHRTSCVAAPRTRRPCRAFTLVELLVVIGIIAILIAVLMPALRRARESANAVQCSSNQRQLMMAFLMFANDHKGHLPGNYWDSMHQQPDPEKRDWLLGDNPNQGNIASQIADGPEKGTIYRYVNKLNVYLCPSVVADGSSLGFGSNGKYDYTAFIVFSGAKITNIKPTARFVHGARVEVMPTPILCEEEPRGGVNGGNIEGGHCNTDRIAHTHPSAGSHMINGREVAKGGGYYASVDGSVHFFNEPLETNSWNWWSRAPSGSEVSLGHVVAWNWWNKQ
jgi:prepilin-type N-terminal cleavage/methylation domain-containing protein